MLFRSQDNLLAGIDSFVDLAESVTLFSAYLKLEALERIDQNKKVQSIVVRWDERDLCGPTPSSDLGVFKYCQDHNILLLRNRRLHIKALWNNANQIMLGSANVTRNGLGLGTQGNLELNAIATQMSSDDEDYLNKIVSNSQVVDRHLYQRLQEMVDNTTVPPITIEKIEAPTSDPFLMSQLPAFRDIENMFESYANPEQSQDREDLHHDLELYKIPTGLNAAEFERKLKSAFNSHPFTLAFVKHLRHEADIYPGKTNRSMKWTQVKNWILDTTSSSRHEIDQDLTHVLRTWYNWLVHFNECITTEQPNITEILNYIESH